jgi:excisionase family DNA binding protein
MSHRPAVNPSTVKSPVDMPAGVNYDPPLTLEQAAAYLNVSVRTLHRYKDASKIDFYKYDGGLRFRVSALERFLAKRQRRAA